MSDSDMLVLIKVEKEMNNAKDENSINKLYRQTRLWLRFQHVYAEVLDRDDYDWCIERLKRFRQTAKEKLRVGDVN